MTAVAAITEPAPAPAMLFGIRAGRSSDHAFIVKSWLAGDQHSPMGRDLGPLYAIEHEITVHTILSRSDVELRVAHAPDDDDAILGFAVVRPSVVFYVYVKRDARKLGIASALLADLRGERAEYASRPVVRGRLPIPPAWTYNPTRLYR